MSRYAYVNGQFKQARNAVTHIEDRGYQFADGIYEVCTIVNGRYCDFDGHFARMQRSLRELRISPPIGRAALELKIRELLKRNKLRTALVYIQVTRGVAPRNHLFPISGTPPVLVMTARRFNLEESDAKARKGVKLASQDDIRWGRVDIKTVGLLPNVLAKQAAAEAGAAEALLVRDRVVTECSASNAWIVDKAGTLITHPKGNSILGGITRETTIACAAELHIKVEERAFTLEEAKAAGEAFYTSATSFVMPVIKIDDVTIADGQPGPVAMRLREAYKAKVCSA